MNSNSERTEFIMVKKIGFIGLGLIGGSIAKAIRKYYPNYELLAFDKNKETLALAVQEECVQFSYGSIDDNFKECSYIFLCAPIHYNAAYLAHLKGHIRPDCILTDVGSVKTPIHKEISRLGLEEHFIGGHPMAGSEKSGFVNSKPVLIENAYYILTPSSKVSPQKVQEYWIFIESLKALPLILDYPGHDQITAAISHLPHIIAASLVNLVGNRDTAHGLMKSLAAGGFKDITRIASSSPVMWQQISQQNRPYISQVLGDYIKVLEDTQKAVDMEDENTLYSLFESAKNYRDSMPDGSAGPIKKSFALYCDIVDETGGIAAIATALASHHISIKNIGIVHNREFEEGVLRIEFYAKETSAEAAGLLEKYGYVIYKV